MMPGTVPTPVIHFVDDDEEFREATARLLRSVGYEIRCYASAADFLLSGEGDRPGCLLLDVNMPGPSGLELQESLAKRTASLPIVFVTGYGDIPTSVRAIKGGAVDFLTKPVTRESLLAAIQSALGRDAERRFEVEQTRLIRARYETLTKRETEVFERVVAGRLNKQIGHELNASERTIKAHRARVMEKMDVKSLAELVQIAVQLRVAGTLRGDRIPGAAAHAAKKGS